MTAKTKKKADDSAGISRLLDKIRTERQKIDGLEGDVVACHIRLGVRLTELRMLAKGTWGRQLKAIDINPRVASRYLKIARHWPNDIGLIESDLLPRLPTDLLKLEWLCRLPLPRLGELLNELDCKKAARSQVIAAVREALGENPPAEDEQDVEKFVQRLVQRFARSVEQLGEKFPDPGQQNRARELLAAGLMQVHDALQADLAREV
jgi:hypothetical protein